MAIDLYGDDEKMHVGEGSPFWLPMPWIDLDVCI